MMWLVRLALKRPYTFVVMSMLIVIVGILTISRMPTDIFPDIDIPVISIVFNYSGLAPEEMEKRMVNNFERGLTTTVNDNEHIESQSLTGVAVVKAFFQPGAKIEAATAQVTAIAQAAIRSMPPGTTPPFIIRYSASNVPIIQVALGSESLSEQQLFDFGINFIRTDLTTIPGIQMPYPYGGKQRLIMIDIDPQRLFAWGLSPRDVNNAITQQNLIVPTGTAKIGASEYPVVLNASPDLLAQIEALPVKTVKGTTVYVRDVAHVRDGYSPQTNIVHVEGARSVLLSILKQGAASTLDVVRHVRETLPQTLTRLPKELIVIVSIPLSILVSIILLSWLGETLNVMTLGGMALAVGILVDDATVEIENVHRNMAQKKPIVRAILDGASEIATPAFVSTLCICIVFVPVVFISGAAKSLFVPLAMAVVFAMLTSYFLSRTLVPTMMRYLMAGEAERHLQGHSPTPRWFGARFIAWFERGFERMRMGYGGLLAAALHHRRPVVIGFLLFVAASLALLPLVGRDFFPTVDAGLIKLHVRGVPGTRIEETERKFVHIENAIREGIPPGEIETMIDNIGIPYSGLNLSLSEGALISAADGQIFIALKKGHQPTEHYVRKMRAMLAE